MNKDANRCIRKFLTDHFRHQQQMVVIDKDCTKREWVYRSHRGPPKPLLTDIMLLVSINDGVCKLTVHSHIIIPMTLLGSTITGRRGLHQIMKHRPQYYLVSPQTLWGHLHLSFKRWSTYLVYSSLRNGHAISFDPERWAQYGPFPTRAIEAWPCPRWPMCR